MKKQKVFAAFLSFVVLSTFLLRQLALLLYILFFSSPFLTFIFSTLFGYDTTTILLALSLLYKKKNEKYLDQGTKLRYLLSENG